MGNAAFEMRIQEDFRGQTMQQYLSRMSDKMQRGAVRSMVSKAGTVLSREIRNQIKRRNMPYSRARNAAERKKTRQAGQKPLLRTIGKKAWSNQRRGIIGSVVGPRYDIGGFHGHLVEFGHRITGHRRGGAFARRRSRRSVVARLLGNRRVRGHGNRTIAHHFQEEAELRSKGEIFNVMEQALSAFIRKQGTRKL